MKNKGLDSVIKQLINEIFRKYKDIDCVILFGSRAKGTATERSDIDLAVVGIDDDLVIESIAIELDELPFPYKFDVQAFNLIINEELRSHIERVGIKIYEKKGKII